MSYQDAIPLLRSLSGKGDLISEWQGGLTDQGVDYYTGPGEGVVNIDNQVVGKVTPIWNVYAIIPGHIHDEIPVLGNHRDAFVFGAGDPNSGTACMLEVVRAFGKMLRKGWRPMRTTVIASWDAEEASFHNLFSLL